MALSSKTKAIMVVALANKVAGTELAAAVDSLHAVAAAANVAALAGTMTGATDGTIADVANIALSTSDTYTDAAVNAAVNTAIASMNLQLKELQVKLNAEIAALKAAGLQNTV